MSAIARYTCIAKDGEEVGVLALISFSCQQIAEMASRQSGRPVCMVLSEEVVDSDLPPDEKLSLKKSLIDMGLDPDGGIDSIPNDVHDSGPGARLVVHPSIFDDQPIGPSVSEIVARLRGHAAPLPRATPSLADPEPVKDAELADIAFEAEIRAEEEFEQQEALVTDEHREKVARVLAAASAPSALVNVSVRELARRDLVFEVSGHDEPEAAPMSVTGFKASLAMLASSDRMRELGKNRTHAAARRDEAILWVVRQLRCFVPEMTYAQMEDYLGLRRAKGMTAYRLAKEVNDEKG